MINARQQTAFFSCPMGAVAQTIDDVAGPFEITSASHQVMGDGSVSVLLVIKGEREALLEHERRVAEMIGVST